MQNDLPNIPLAYPSSAKKSPRPRPSKGAILARSALFALVILILLSVLDVFPHRYDQRQVDKIKMRHEPAPARPRRDRIRQRA